MEFESKTVLVTGATSGIGFATTRRLLELGCTVLAVGRNTSRLDELEAIAPPKLRPLKFDLCNFDDYRDFVSSLPALDGVVHSAGVANSNPLRFFSLDKYRQVVDINQTAPTMLTAEILRSNKMNPRGSFVFLSSINGTRVGIRGSTAYGASKAALVAISRVVALEVGHKGIRSNCISPGNIETEMIKNLSELSDSDREIDRRRYPLESRFGRVDEAVEGVLFLLSDRSSFMTGQNLVMDGGYTAL